MAHPRIPEEKQRMISVLDEQGLPRWQIAKELEIADSTVDMYLNPERRKSHALSKKVWLRRHRGVCVDCGNPTGSPANLGRKRCQSCHSKKMISENKGKGKNQLRILELLSEGEMTLAEIADQMGLDHSHAWRALKSMVEVGSIKRVRRGVYMVVSDD